MGMDGVVTGWAGMGMILTGSGVPSPACFVTLTEAGFTANGHMQVLMLF